MCGPVDLMMTRSCGGMVRIVVLMLDVADCIAMSTRRVVRLWGEELRDIDGEGVWPFDGTRSEGLEAQGLGSSSKLDGETLRLSNSISGTSQ